MTRSLILAALTCALCAPVVVAAPIPAADVVIIADESGSMFSAYYTWLASMIQALEIDYKAAGVGFQPAFPNRYALFGYGSPTHQASELAHPHGSWMNAAAMANNITTNLQVIPAGAIEDGYEAINTAVTTLAFRTGAFKTVILITDEDRDQALPALTIASICQLLGAKDATLNSIVNGGFKAGVATALGVKWNGTAYIPTGGSNYITAPGGTYVAYLPGGNNMGSGTTLVDYVELSRQTCGSSWDIWQSWTNGAAMTNAFTDVKVEELAPMVQTLGAQTCADWMLAMGCLLYNGGQDCWYWFEYRELGSLMWQQSTVWYPALEGQIFTDYIRGLKPGTWYQVRAMVQNSVMKAKGADWCVQTRAPEVTQCGPWSQGAGSSCATNCGCK